MLRGHHKVTTSLRLYASIKNETKRDSDDAVEGTTDSSCLRYFLCLLPLTHDLPFIVPSHFSFIRFTVGRAFNFSVSVSVVASVGITTGLPGTAPLLSYVNSFIIAATAGAPNFLNPALALSCVNTTLHAILMYVTCTLSIYYIY